MGKLIPMYVNETLAKYGVENAHDKLFKSLLDDKEELKTFITKFVRINILNEEIEKCNHNYITNKYKLYEADMIYKIKEKPIYFLIEHQSTVDKNMPYRIFNYYIQEVNEVKDRENEGNPLIIPIVLYTGEEKWKAKRLYSETIEKQYGILKKYAEMEYELVDINSYTEEELLQTNTLLTYAMLIEKNRGRDSLVTVLEKISRVCGTNKNRKKMQGIINYILYPILQEDTEKMLKKFKMKEELNMKTAQDYIREEIRELKRKAIEEGLAEGRKKGREEGREEGRVEGIEKEQKCIIINMLKNKLKIEEIKKYTGVDEEKIEKIAASI